MRTFSLVLKRVAKNKVLQYLFSRYLTFFILFINSLFIAVFLGPFYLGIWGFITLVVQYLNQINLGIAYSVNALIAVNKDKELYVQKVVGTGMTMIIGLTLLIIFIYILDLIFHINFGEKYNFSKYAPIVLFIGIIGHFNSLLSSVFRVYGRTTEIAFSQSSFPVLMLLAILFFRNEDLLWALIVSNLLAFLLSFGLFVWKTPLKLTPLFALPLMKTIQKKGWYLFIYNASFYLIIISTKSFISGYYKIEEFGYFTFAFSLANAILLFLDALSYLIYPKILHRFATSTNKKTILLLNKLRNTYITSSHLLVHLALLFFPVFLIFFPDYKDAGKAFSLIALTIVLYTNSFGYSGLLIAKGKEKILGTISFVALLINVLLAYLFSAQMSMPFSEVIFATMLTYILYVFFLTREGRKLLKMDAGFISICKDAYPLRLIIPYLISLLITTFSAPGFYLILPIIILVTMNFSAIKVLRELVGSIILDPKITDI